MSQLIDRFGRIHDYLRISVTDRCNLRCTYCMPEEGIGWKSSNLLLNSDEIVRVARLMAEMGVKKIRLTGGEPTTRSDLSLLVSRLAEIPGIEDICLTTNGVLFSKFAEDLKRAGLSHVNISLDSLNRENFIRIARRDLLDSVLKSLDAALDCGFEQVKLNMVVMAGTNEHEMPDFVEVARTKPVNVRFIEYMPFKGNRWDPRGVVTYNEMRSRLEASYDLRALPDTYISNRVAEDFMIPGFLGKVSFIASMSNSFCSTCSRLRLTADGALKACLFFPAQVHLRESLRANQSDEVIRCLITDAVQSKPKGHPDPSELEQLNDLSMIEIGG
ncbi:MAG: GTP 3',8-cyclase MoaA [Calditrichaeota bacterium]|nr:GTP 3',8-cyclase MoaA [Calditrichota bacterium]MCB9367541.1 GTP 3',8-cyclase MoaA [Calditrichota bacterium]